MSVTLFAPLLSPDRDSGLSHHLRQGTVSFYALVAQTFVEVLRNAYEYPFHGLWYGESKRLLF